MSAPPTPYDIAAFRRWMHPYVEKLWKRRLLTEYEIAAGMRPSEAEEIAFYERHSDYKSEV